MAPQETDIDLVQSVLSGNEDAFEVLVVRHQRGVVHYLFRMVGDWERALELAQDAFLRAFRALSSYRAEYRFTTWLYAIARNCARNELRDRARRVRLVAETEGPDAGKEAAAGGEPDAAAILDEQARAVRAALGLLPEHYRSVVVLAEYEKLPYEEIARILGRPRGTIKSWIFRAKKQLYKLLKDSGMVD